jgi:hypothetical protein
MRIATSERHGCVVLDVAGRLDPAAARVLRGSLLTALGECLCGVVVDLADMETDEPGLLRVFAEAGRQAAAWPGAPLALCGPDPVLADHLRGLGEGRLLRIRPTVAQALRDRLQPASVVRDVLYLPPLPPAAAAAREFVADACRGQSPDLIADVVLMASELVTNAVHHARTELTLSVILQQEVIRLAVGDRQPLFGTEPHRMTHGWGIHLLDSVATAWGVLPRSGGKLVWCLLSDREVPTPMTVGARYRSPPGPWSERT